jgi:hypothetical protein
MTRVVVEITDHDNGASTDFKTMTASDEFSSENEKRWMKTLAESIFGTLQRMSRERLGAQFLEDKEKTQK